MATIQDIIDKLKLRNKSNRSELKYANDQLNDVKTKIFDLEDAISENERTIAQLESTKPICACKNPNGPPPPCGVDDLPTFGLWQPIETAPKDKAILLFGKFWSDRQWTMKEPMQGYWSNHNERWECVWSCRFVVHPTHWMPLPPIPQTKD